MGWASNLGSLGSFFGLQELEHNVFLRASRADVPDEEMGKLRRGHWAAGRWHSLLSTGISMYFVYLTFL